MAQLEALGEVRWIDDLLPEFIWIGLLLDRHGIPRTLRILESIVDSDPGFGAEEESWLSRCSTYGRIDDKGRVSLLEGLASSDHLRDLQAALGPLVSHYPKCPFHFLYKNSPPEGSLDVVRQATAQALDRWNEHATWMQIAAVYMVIGQGKLHFAKDSVFADFPEVEHYPHTERARQIASACRATINSFPLSMRKRESLEWIDYFWARGLELDPCTPLTEALDDGQGE